MADAVKVRILDRDWHKIMTYLRLAKPDEIIGLAHAEIKDGAINVFDPLILKQKVGPATCEIEPKALVKFIGDHGPIDKVRVVWHSHVDMGARFSTCDRDTSNTLAALGKMMSGASSWWVSIVVNLKQEFECVVDMYSPFRTTIPAEVVLFTESVPGLDEQVKELVERTSQTYSRDWGYSDHGPHGGPYGGSIEVRGGARKGRGNGGASRPDAQEYSHDDVFGEVSLGGGD